MGGGGTETSTQTSGLSNPAMNAAATTIGNQLNSALQTGVKPFTGSLVPELSSQTQQGIGGLANNPNNADFSRGIGNTIDEFSAIASGQRMGAGDAGWNAARDRALTDVGAMFTTSGRFGSGSHAERAVEGLAATDLARLQGNEARQMSAAGMLPGLYQGSQLPAQAQLASGQIMDAWNTASAADKERIFDATQNAPWNTLQRGGAIFSGTAPVSGTTQSTTQPTAPWWQQMLGAGAIGSGIYKNVWGS